jgi:hypothetical protein
LHGEPPELDDAFGVIVYLNTERWMADLSIQKKAKAWKMLGM